MFLNGCQGVDKVLRTVLGCSAIVVMAVLILTFRRREMVTFPHAKGSRVWIQDLDERFNPFEATLEDTVDLDMAWESGNMVKVRAKEDGTIWELDPEYCGSYNRRLDREYEDVFVLMNIERFQKRIPTRWPVAPPIS